jgi:type II secretory pathway component PulF
MSDTMERFGQRIEVISVITVGTAVAGAVIAIYLPLFMIPSLIR